MIPDRTVAPPVHQINLTDLKYPDRHFFQQKFPGIIITDDTNPVVMLEFLFRGGKLTEEKPGTAFLTSKMLMEGTRKLDREALVMAFESKGGYIEINSGQEHVSLKLYALKKNFLHCLGLVGDLLTNSIFPEDSLETLKSIRKSTIRNQLSKNNQFATLKFNELIYGLDHPIGQMPDLDKTDSVTISDVTEYYRAYLKTVPKVILSGDVKEGHIEALEDLLGIFQLSSGNANKLEAQATFGVFEEKRSKGEQTSIRMGSDCVDMRHPDIYKVKIANAMLGGYFGSRLMSNIREKKGLTYGIYSALVQNNTASYWLIGSELKSEMSNEAYQEILKEINTLANENPDHKETEKLRNYLKGKMQISMGTLFGRVNFYRNLFKYDLNWDYAQEYWESLDSISPSEISEVIGKYYLTSDRIDLFVR